MKLSDLTAAGELAARKEKLTQLGTQVLEDKEGRGFGVVIGGSFFGDHGLKATIRDDVLAYLKREHELVDRQLAALGVDA